LDAVWNITLDHTEVFEKNVIDVRMHGLEASLETFYVRVDFETGNATKPLNNIPDSVLLSRREKASNDPPWIGR
jgi:hypothetical protein